MKKIIGLLLATLLCLTLVSCAELKDGQQIFEIVSDSMAPLFEAGDKIVCEPVDPTDLRAGDVIAYWTIIDGQRVVNVHRILNIYDGGNYLIFETKGDNNASADALTVHQNEIIGIYVRTLSFTERLFS